MLLRPPFGYRRVRDETILTRLNCSANVSPALEIMPRYYINCSFSLCFFIEKVLVGLVTTACLWGTGRDDTALILLACAWAGIAFVLFVLLPLHLLEICCYFTIFGRVVGGSCVVC